jgi:hypothetical protein
MVEHEFPGPAADRVMAELGAMSSLEHKHASAELTSVKVASSLSDASSRLPIPPAPQQPLMVDSMGLPLRTSQQQVSAMHLARFTMHHTMCNMINAVLAHSLASCDLFFAIRASTISTLPFTTITLL